MIKRKGAGLAAFKSFPAYLEIRGWQGKPMVSSKELGIYEVDNVGLICDTAFCFEFSIPDSKYIFYIQPEFKPSEGLTPQIFEYICRANLEIPIGNFEVCDDPGLYCHFKSGIDYSRHPLTPSLLDGAIDSALSSFDRFFPGLLWVIAGNNTPAETIGRIKSGEGLGKGFERALRDWTTGTTVAVPGAGVAAFEYLPAYLRKRGWQGRRVKGKPTYRVDVKGERVPVQYFLEVDIDRMQFHFTIVPRIVIPKGRWLAVAEYCCHRSFSLKTEHFDFDIDEGKISIKSSVDFSGMALSFSIIDGVVEPVLKQLKYFEYFHNGLVKVIYEHEDPYLAFFGWDDD